MLYPLIIFFFLTNGVFSQSIIQYTIQNRCPADINLYIGGRLDGLIPTGDNVTRFLAPDAGPFYTDANGGNANGVGSTKAGFYLQSSYYYVVVDPNHFNTGINISPRPAIPRSAFCRSIECDDITCANVFTQTPTTFPPFQTGVVPPLPLFGCSNANTTFDIIFCPLGFFGNQGVAIHPNGNLDKCLDYRGRVFGNGVPVQIFDCLGSTGQRWHISRGSTKVKLANENFCLDAGSSPGNGVGMKLWQCYDNLPAQQWYFTDDDRIALEGKGLCLDLPGGDLTNGNQAQTWQCTNGNLNQVWTVL
ncbi:ricin B lectin domain-containing protein [Crucibulum laeve]|uniref:Ricin B lectin domain-containing protein n=1 Tax=Crucibulum laeve TaxID=68775 RepID=A0A5C3M9X7_9AGAR|nr:ricin B lectin domain-containing protein [Crucibulum laeve]